MKKKTSKVAYFSKIAGIFGTGYSLSDQYIFAPISPKYDNLFCQIYKDLNKLFWNSKLAKLAFLI